MKSNERRSKRVLAKHNVKKERIRFPKKTTTSHQGSVHIYVVQMAMELRMCDYMCIVTVAKWENRNSISFSVFGKYIYTDYNP